MQPLKWVHYQFASDLRHCRVLVRLPAAAAHRKYEQYTKHVVSLRVILVKMNDDLRLHTDKTPNQTKPNTHMKNMKLGIN